MSNTFTLHHYSLNPKALLDGGRLVIHIHRGRQPRAGTKLGVGFVCLDCVDSKPVRLTGEPGTGSLSHFIN